jgi:hypothetical protein
VAETGDGSRRDDFVLGYAVDLVNSELGIELSGLPEEILTELSARGRTGAEVLAHPRTRVRTTQVFKDFPDLVIPGGPHAEALMDLMMAVDEADADLAGRVVADHPALVSGAPAGAAVPLISAVARGRDEIVQVLAKEGVGLEGDVGMGMAPLHWAALLGSPETVRVLCRAGAATERRSWLMASPAELARANGRRDVERQLVGRLRRAKALSPQETLTRMMERSA